MWTPRGVVKMSLSPPTWANGLQQSATAIGWSSWLCTSHPLKPRMVSYPNGAGSSYATGAYRGWFSQSLVNLCASSSEAEKPPLSLSCHSHFAQTQAPPSQRPQHRTLCRIDLHTATNGYRALLDWGLGLQTPSQGLHVAYSWLTCSPWRRQAIGVLV